MTSASVHTVLAPTIGGTRRWPNRWPLGRATGAAGNHRRPSPSRLLRRPRPFPPPCRISRYPGLCTGSARSALMLPPWDAARPATGRSACGAGRSATWAPLGLFPEPEPLGPPPGPQPLGPPPGPQSPGPPPGPLAWAPAGPQPAAPLAVPAEPAPAAIAPIAPPPAAPLRGAACAGRCATSSGVGAPGRCRRATSTGSGAVRLGALVRSGCPEPATAVMPTVIRSESTRAHAGRRTRC